MAVAAAAAGGAGAETAAGGGTAVPAGGMGTRRVRMMFFALLVLGALGSASLYARSLSRLTTAVPLGTDAAEDTANSPEQRATAALMHGGGSGEDLQQRPKLIRFDPALFDGTHEAIEVPAVGGSGVVALDPTLFAGSQMNRHAPLAPHAIPHRSVPPTKRVPLMLLKLPRSGSSWFTELLNSRRDVFLSKEIIQHTHVSKYSVKFAEKHLKYALRHPADKLGDHWYNPSGRFGIDYLRPLKWLTTLHINGFTLNPLHYPDANYTQILQAVPGARVVAFVRTNMIKLGVSALRGAMVNSMCGEANLRASTKCTIPDKIKASPLQLLRLVREEIDRSIRFQKIVYDMHVPVLEITYEDLQKDTEGTCETVFSYLLGEEKTVRKGHDGWTKRTSDDLRDVISNFDELDTMLREEVGVPCLTAQLHVIEPQPLSPCYPLEAVDKAIATLEAATQQLRSASGAGGDGDGDGEKQTRKRKTKKRKQDLYQ